MGGRHRHPRALTSGSRHICQTATSYDPEMAGSHPTSRSIAPFAACALLVAVLSACDTTMPIQTAPGVTPSTAPTASMASITSPSASPSVVDMGSLIWHRLADTGQLSDPAGGVGIVGLAKLRNGSLVAIGNGPEGGRVWRSPDGLSFELLPRDPALRNANLGSLVLFGDQLVLAGAIVNVDFSSKPALWSSQDGLRWMPLAAPTGIFEAGHLVAVGDLLYLAATVKTGESEVAPSVWMSRDARTWTSAPSVAAGGAEISGAAVGPAGPILVGTMHESDGGRAVAWHSATGGLAKVTMSESWVTSSAVDSIASTASGYVAIGDQVTGSGEDLGVAIWHSVDGVTWIESHAGIPDDAALGPLAEDGRTFVLAGVADGHQRMWTSVDGHVWTAGPDLARLDSRGTLTIDAMVAGGGEIVAVGSADGALAAVGAVLVATSPDATIAEWTGDAVPPRACPTGRIDIVAIVARPNSDRLRCFGSRTLRLRAWVAGPTDLGGVSAYKGIPEWLNDPLSYGTFLQAVDAPFGRANVLVGHLRPGVRFSRVNTWASVTGHFDDPAADTCRLIAYEASTEPVPMARAISHCRSEFVITAIVRTTAA